MKQLLTAAAIAVATATGMSAQEPTLVVDVLEGHTDSWSTYKAGPWSIDLSTKEFRQLTTANPWTIYGNCGAIHKDSIYYTFFGGEKYSEDDLAGLDTEYGYAEQKIVVRKWNDQTWQQVGNAVTYSPNSRLAFSDLTYDPNDDEVYCVMLVITGSGDNAFSGYRFGTLDLETMTTRVLSQKDLPVEVRAIAAHPNGKLYAIDYSGYLYTVNKQTGDLTTVGFTGHRNQRRMQSMVADWRTGRLFFAGYMNDGTDHSREGNRYGTALYEVNPETAELTQLFTFPAKEEVSGLYVVGDIVRHDHDVNVKLVCPEQLRANEAATITATVRNVGKLTAESYTVTLFANGLPVATATGEAIDAGERDTLMLTFTPNVSLGADVELYAQVTLAGDENAVNDSTEPAAVRIIGTTLPTVSVMGMREGNNVMLAWDAPATTAIYTETFERYQPFIIADIGDWTLVERSGKQATYTMNSYEGAHTYPNAGRPFAYQVFNPSLAGFYPEQYAADTCTYYCQSGDQMLISVVGAKQADNTEGYELVQSDSWLISPELSGNAQTISFYAKCWTSQVAYFGEYASSAEPEQFRVLYSTEGTDPDSFVALTTDPVTATKWFSDGAFTFNLPEGARHFAIQSITQPCYEDNYMQILFIDDISYQPATPHLVGYNVYKNGTRLNSEVLTTPEFTDTDVAELGVSNYGVSAVYEEGESAISNIFSVVGTRVGSITAATTAPDGYYTLAGQHLGLTQPRHSGIYIVRQGQHSHKIIVK